MAWAGVAMAVKPAIARAIEATPVRAAVLAWRVGVRPMVGDASLVDPRPPGGQPQDPFVDTVPTNGQEKPYTVFGTRWIPTVVQTTGAEGTSENGFHAACEGSKAEDFKSGQAFPTGNSQQRFPDIFHTFLHYVALLRLHEDSDTGTPRTRRLYLHYTTSFPTPCHPAERENPPPAHGASLLPIHTGRAGKTAGRILCHPAQWGH